MALPVTFGKDGNSIVSICPPTRTPWCSPQVTIDIFIRRDLPGLGKILHRPSFLRILDLNQIILAGIDVGSFSRLKEGGNGRGNDDSNDRDGDHDFDKGKTPGTRHLIAPCRSSSV